MPKQEQLKLTVEDAEIIFKNFAGVERKFNVAGDRNFNVVLDDATATAMQADGWNVKWKDATVDDDTGEELREGRWTLKVSIGYKTSRKPRITLLTSATKTRLSEDMIEILDEVDFKQADIKVNGSHWGDADKGGVKAWLDNMYVIMEEDELDLKYADWGQPADTYVGGGNDE